MPAAAGARQGVSVSRWWTDACCHAHFLAELSSRVSLYVYCQFIFVTNEYFPNG